MAKIYDEKKPKSTARKVVSTILGIIFVVLVVVAVLIGTYVFSSPSTEGESADIIRGQWEDKDNHILFTFDKEGNFKVQDTTDSKKPKTLAKGYFKIDTEGDKIKLLVLPKDRDKDFKMGEQLKFFSTLNYRDLKAKQLNAFKTNEKDDSTCTFIFANDNSVYECRRVNAVETFYGDKKNEDLKN